MFSPSTHGQLLFIDIRKFQNMHVLTKLANGCPGLFTIMNRCTAIEKIPIGPIFFIE